MSQLVNRKVVLKSHPQGALKESDFEIVNDEVVVDVLHRNSLLNIHCWITICIYPSLNTSMPSLGCLLGTVDTLEKLQDMTLGDNLGPPLLQENEHLVIAHHIPV